MNKSVFSQTTASWIPKAIIQLSESPRARQGMKVKRKNSGALRRFDDKGLIYTGILI